MKQALIHFLCVLAIFTTVAITGCGTSVGMNALATSPTASPATPSPAPTTGTSAPPSTSGGTSTGTTVGTTTGTGTTGTGTTTPGSTSSVPSTATVFADIQAMTSWQSCAACAGAGGNGPVAPFSMTQHLASPSLAGNATQFSIAGLTPYSDVLWWRTLVGDAEVAKNQGLHHFVYDLYYYMDNPGAAQAIEFDIDQYVDGRSLIFGSQCDYRGDDTWDVWDNVNGKWVSTGVSCGIPAAFTWTHVVLEVERTADNRLHYISLTLNDTKHLLDAYYASTTTSWNGMDVNYQMDGNFQQENYSTWVDKMTLSAW